LEKKRVAFKRSMGWNSPEVKSEKDGEKIRKGSYQFVREHSRSRKIQEEDPTVKRVRECLNRKKKKRSHLTP